MQANEHRVVIFLRVCFVLGLLLISGELALYEHEFDLAGYQNAAKAAGYAVACLVSAVLSVYLTLISISPELLSQIMSRVPGTDGFTALSSTPSMVVRGSVLLTCFTATDISYSLGGNFEVQFVLIVLNVLALACILQQCLRWRAMRTWLSETFSAAPESRADSQDSSSSDDEEGNDGPEEQHNVLLHVVHICGGTWAAAVTHIATEPHEHEYAVATKVTVSFAIPIALGIILRMVARSAYNEARVRCAAVMEHAYESPLRSFRRALRRNDLLAAATNAGVLITPVLVSILAALLSLLAAEFMGARHGSRGQSLPLAAIACISLVNSCCFVLCAARQRVYQGLIFVQSRASADFAGVKGFFGRAAVALINSVRPCSSKLADHLEVWMLRERPRTKARNAMHVLCGNRMAQVLCLLVLLAVWSILLGSLAVSRRRGALLESDTVQLHDIGLDTGSVDVWRAQLPASAGSGWTRAQASLQRRRNLVLHIQKLGLQRWAAYTEVLDALALLTRQTQQQGGGNNKLKEASSLQQAAANGNSRAFERKELSLAHALVTMSQDQEAIEHKFFWCGHFGLFPLTKPSSAAKSSSSPWTDCEEAVDRFVVGNHTTHVRQAPLPSYYSTRKSMLSRLQCLTQSAQNVGSQRAPSPLDGPRTAAATCAHAAQLALLPPSQYSRVFPLSLALPQDTSVALTLLGPEPLSSLGKYIDQRVAAKGLSCEDCPPEARIDGDGIGQNFALRKRLRTVQYGAQGKVLKQDWSAGFVMKSTMHSDGQLAQEWHKREQQRLHVRPVIQAEHKAVANSTAVLTQRLRSRISAMRARGRLRGTVASNSTRHSRTRLRPGHHSPVKGSSRQLRRPSASAGHKARTSTLRPFYDSFQAKVDDLKLPSGRSFGITLNAITLLKPLRVYIHQGGVSVSMSAGPQHPLQHCRLNSHARALKECQSDDKTIAPGTMSTKDMLQIVTQELHTSTAQVWSKLVSQATRAVLAVAQYSDASKEFNFEDFALVGDTLPAFFGRASQFMAQLRGELLSQAFQVELVFDRRGHPWVVDLQPHHDELLLSKHELFNPTAAVRRMEFLAQQFWLLGSGSQVAGRILHPLKREVCSNLPLSTEFFESSTETFFGNDVRLRQFLEQASESYQKAEAAGHAMAEQQRLSQVFEKITAVHKAFRLQLSNTSQVEGKACRDSDDKYVERFLHEHLSLTPQGWFRAFPVADISAVAAMQRNLSRSAPSAVAALGTSGLRFPFDCGKLSALEAYQADRDYTRLMQPLLRSGNEAEDRPSVLYHAVMHALQRRYEWYRRWAQSPASRTAETAPSATLLWLAKEWFQW